MKRTHIGGGVVWNNTLSRLVIVKQGNSACTWSLPKGHIEEGESARVAAEREIAEETGIKNISYVKDLGAYERYRMARGGGDDLSELKTLQMFLFTTEEEILSPSDKTNPEARWVTVEEGVETLTHPKDKAFLKSIEYAIKKISKEH